MKHFPYFFLALLMPGSILAFQHKSTILDSTIVEVNGITIFKSSLDALDGLPHTKRENFVHEVWAVDEEGNEEEWVIKEGIVYNYIPEKHASRLFEILHEEVLRAGSYLFLTNTNFDADYNSYYDLVILSGTDPYKIIKDMGVMAVNYDLYTNDIILKLKEWDKKLGLTFEVIEGDQVSAYMSKTPDDPKSFAKEVYEFCPDIVDQGFGSMRELIKSYKEFLYLYLWWD